MSFNRSKYNKITKRDGSVEKFSRIKITNAIYSACKNTKLTPRKECNLYTNKVIDAINLSASDICTVEFVQDCVERVLMESVGYEVAKAYILYRHEHTKERNIHNTLINAGNLVDGYLDQSDWRVRENANASYSYASLLNHVSGAVVAEYTLTKMYPTYIADAHRNGDFHIHDLSCGIVLYCGGWSLRELLNKGFIGTGGRASAAPAKHLDAILGQMVNFMFTLQSEFAGAQAFNCVDTYLAPFIRYDNLSYRQLKQAVSSFLFQCNIASRWGQTSFTNLSFDWVCPDDLKDHPVIIGGQYGTDTYGDFQKEMDLFNKAFLEVMLEGDRDGRLFSFPIPTYSLTKDFDWNSENANLLFEMTAKYGVPYFQNFISSDLDPSQIRAMCCRLQVSLSEIRKKTGGVFGAGDQTGSIGVITLNMPLLGYLSSDEKDFFDRLSSLMDIAKEALEIKRDIIQQNYDNGLTPYTKIYLSTIDNHFSTIGLVGMNECCLNFFGEDITTDKGQEFSIRVLEYMKNKTVEYQEETGHLFNSEAVPAEGTSFRLAKLSKSKYPDLICAGDTNVYFTNSSQLPVNYTEDVFKALDKQDALQCSYTGGTVFHAFLGEAISGEACKKLVRAIATNYKIPYFSITPTFSICPTHGYISGEHFTCPHCEEKTT